MKTNRGSCISQYEKDSIRDFYNEGEVYFIEPNFTVLNDNQLKKQVHECRLKTTLDSARFNALELGLILWR